MSGGSAANTSWTLLTSEESVCDTMRPLVEGTEYEVSVENQPAGDATSAKGDMAPETEGAELNGDGSAHPAVLSSSDPSGSFPGDGDALSQSEGLPEGPTQGSADLDSFSDSFTNITASSAEPAASVLNTETVGRVDLTPEDERLSDHGGRHLNAEGLQEEGLQPDLCQTENQAGSTEASEVAAGEEGPQLRRRRRSLLATLERIGRAEEEEEKEEDFQLPRQQVDSGFSVNKCILAALILLGLGTIFFSESDYVTTGPGDTGLPEKQEWLSTEVPQTDAETTELLKQLARGSQQVSELQTQLQAQAEELKAAKGLAEEGAKERLQWGEVEKENSRLKTKMASLPVLQKENQRMKKELESLPALQRELEALRATVTEFKLSTAPNELPDTDSTAPPSGQAEDGAQGAAEFTGKEKAGDEQRIKHKDQDPNKKHKGMDEEKTGEKSDWMEGGKKSGYGGKAEWEKFSEDKYKKGKKMYQKDSASRGEEGKPWKDGKGEKRWEEKTERKGRNGEKNLEKEKPLYEGNKLKKGQKKDWKGADNEKRKDSEERKKKEGGYEESSKEKWVRNHRKDKEGKKEWKTEGEWKNGKEESKKRKWKSDDQKSRDPRKDGKGWNESKRPSGAEWKTGTDDRKDERKERGERKHAEKKRDGKNDWQPWEQGRPTKRKDRDGTPFQRDAPEFPGHHEAKQGGRGPPQRRAPLEQPQYWLQQRTRLQRNPRPPQHCHSVETCAHDEGLPPVPWGEFQAVLQTYLARAQEVGVDASAREELRKLATEFFRDGVFVHDQMRFQDFLKDLGDVLEDMVEGEDDDDEEDSHIEDQMEGFHKEVMRKFALTRVGGKREWAKGDRRKEGRRGHA